MATAIQVRSHGVWAALAEAAAADAEIEAWRTDLERNRHVDVGRSLERALGTPLDAATHNLAWILLGPDTYRSMVTDRRMSTAELEEWLSAALTRLVDRDPQPKRPRSTSRPAP